eukprot:COSAG02_NODE_3433_length_6750_cov_29.777477_3_plen_925_part_00
MIAPLLSASLVAAAETFGHDTSAGHCLGVSNRVDCGYTGISAVDCHGRNCCSASVDRVESRVGWNGTEHQLFHHAFAAEPPACFYGAEGVPVDKVLIIQSNHFDGGYTAAHEPPRYQTRYTGALLSVLNMYFVEYFPAAVATSAELRQRGGPERLRYMTHAYIVDLYLNCPPRRGLRCPPLSAVEAFTAAAKRGDIWWHAMPHNAELATMAPHTIAAAIGVTHSLDDRLALPRRRVVSQRDVPGLPRAVLPIMAQAGVRAISVGANGAVLPPNVPPAFVWRDGDPSSEYVTTATASAAAAQSRAGLQVAAPSGQELLVLFHGYGYGKEPGTGEPAGSKWQPGGLDKRSAKGPDYVQLPGSNIAMVYSWRKDNEGPPNASQVLSDFADARSWFPKAEVVAGTLDEFVSEVTVAQRARVPVITADLSDSWLMGMSSDPIKGQRMRAIDRVIAAHTVNDSGTVWQSDPFCASFMRQFIKAGEHTYGRDHRGWPKDGLLSNGWSNAEFHRAVLANQTAQYQWMPASWQEQRDWALRYPVDALAEAPPGSLPRTIETAIKDELAQLVPVASLDGLLNNSTVPPRKGNRHAFIPVPLVTNAQQMATATLQRLGGWADLSIGRDGGFFLKDATGRSKYSWSSASQTGADASGSGSSDGGMGALVYQSLNDDSYRGFREEYLLDPEDNETYGKPGLTADVAPERLWKPTLTKAFVANGTDSAAIVCLLQFPTHAHLAFGAPAEAWVRLDIRGQTGRSLNLTVQLVNKTATRVAEAMYLRLPNPDRMDNSHSSASAGRWMMDKLGEYSSPLDQVDGAGKGLQYITSGLAYVSSDVSSETVSNGTELGRPQFDASREQVLLIESPDVGLVRWGEPLPFPTPLRGNVSLAAGASFVVFDNAWNTNFLYWWPFVGAEEATADGLYASAIFRWRLHL